MCPNDVKDVHRVSLAIVQEEENWRAMMSEVGGGVEDVTERPASVFHLQQSSTICCSLLPFAVTGVASSLQD